MDTSNSMFDTVAFSNEKGSPIPMTELNEMQWYELIRHSVKQCLSQIRYLSGFTEIRRYLNCIDHGLKRTADDTVVSCPLGFDGHIRIVQMMMVELITLQLKDGTVIAGEPQHGKNTVEEVKELMLTDGGEFLLCHYRWERFEEKGDGYQELQVYQFVRFSPIAWRGWMEILHHRYGEDKSITAGAIIFSKLFHWVNDDVKKREERLRKLQKVQTELQKIHTRFVELPSEV